MGEVLLGTGPTTGLIVSPEAGLFPASSISSRSPTRSWSPCPMAPDCRPSWWPPTIAGPLVLLKVESEPARRARGRARGPVAGRPVGDRGGPHVRCRETQRFGRHRQCDGPGLGPGDPDRRRDFAANYGGPLVDISGRVLGVLVPWPESTSQVAGVEWYDSGIGFAVPLDHILKMLPRGRRAKICTPASWGSISKGTIPYTQPAVVAACRVNSPAYEANLQAGDTIVEINGKPVTRQAQLKQELNRFYAGDKIHLVVLRAEQRIEHDIELIDKLQPYEFPFLGILPVRPVATTRRAWSSAMSIPAVRRPTPACGPATGSFRSRAARSRTPPPRPSGSGSLHPTPSGNRIGARGQNRWARNRSGPFAGSTRQPSRPPSRRTAAVKAAGGAAARPGLVDIKIPEVKNECLAYVPPDYNPDPAYGVVLWLHAPGGDKQDELLARWQDRCQKHDLILLAPKSADPSAGSASEVNSSSKRSPNRQDLSSRPHADHRAWAGGWRLARLSGGPGRHGNDPRDCPGAAPMPPLAAAPDNDPLHRLAFLIATASKSPFAPRSGSRIKNFARRSFPSRSAIWASSRGT